MITAVLGVRWGDKVERLVVLDHPAEPTPEAVFVACNRLDDLETDCANLAPWQAEFRRLLDHTRAPSMSVGDSIELHSITTGAWIGGWTCESVGWSTIDTDPRLILVDRHDGT